MIKKIEQLAPDRGWTLYKLAKESGLTPTIFYTMRKNDAKLVTFDTMEKIADALDISLDEFRKRNGVR